MENHQQNVEMLINAFKVYFNHVVQTQNINLAEFVQFMEPKFAAAGYRDSENTPPPQMASEQDFDFN